MTDAAQLSGFIGGVDSGLCVTEQLLGIKSMDGTTSGRAIFDKVSKCVNEMNLPWVKLMRLRTDGVPSMCSEKNRLVGRMEDRRKREKRRGELTMGHCVIYQGRC